MAPDTCVTISGTSSSGVLEQAEVRRWLNGSDLWSKLSILASVPVAAVDQGFLLINARLKPTSKQ